jgi:uncharacterized protein YndB with AHSA1/START domain
MLDMTTQVYFWINHAIYASRERVFRAWTEPEEVRGWYRGEPIVYREVDPPSRLVFAIGGDEDLAIVTLSTVGDHTVMTFEGAAPAAEADAVERRWSEMLYRLADQVIHSGGNTGGIRPG